MSHLLPDNIVKNIVTIVTSEINIVIQKLIVRTCLLCVFQAGTKASKVFHRIYLVVKLVTILLKSSSRGFQLKGRHLKKYFVNDCIEDDEIRTHVESNFNNNIK